MWSPGRARVNPAARPFAKRFSAVDPDDLYVGVLAASEIRRGIELLRRRDTRGATALDRVAE